MFLFIWSISNGSHHGDSLFSHVTNHLQVLEYWIREEGDEISTETLKETDLGIVQAFISPLK